VSETRASLSIVAGRMSRVDDPDTDTDSDTDPDTDSDPDPDLDETMKHIKLHENQEFPLAFQKTRAMPSRVFVVKQSIPIAIPTPTPIWMKP